jgi:hypothetical protein
MRVLIFIVLVFAISGCGTRQDATDIEHAPARVAASETPFPTEEGYPTIPTVDAKPLTKNQKKELDSTLPPKVREILEKADALDVLGLSSEEKAGIGWYPDVRTVLPIGNERTELLRSFFFDASAGPNPSACFIPRHGLRARYKGKTVNVIICYQCHLFVVEGDLGKFNGGVYKDGSAAHHLFENIIRTKGEPIK